MKKGPEVYDDFYATIYNDLVYVDVEYDHDGVEYDHDGTRMDILN